MRVRYQLYCVTLVVATVFQANNTLLAQDVAAAARANRASHNNNAASVTADSEWYSPTRASMRAQDQGVAATILYEICANQDLRITMETVEKGKKEIAEMMVINGQWMLAKNVPLEKGYEIDALDGVVLNLKLALELLRAAAPGGPTGIKQKTTFEVKEGRRSIAVNTASASGGLEAPWTLHAIIEPSGLDQWSFELQAKHRETMHINGTWQKEAAPPTFSDDLSLDGWQILSIGPIKTTDGNSTILDYGAQISQKHLKTLGELRKMSARQDHLLTNAQ